MNKLGQLRADAMRHVGCIACLLEGHPETPYECHHVVNGAYKDDERTLPLCPYHHRGVCEPGYTPAMMEAKMGPSLALNKRAFIEAYDTEDNLVHYVNRLIGWDGEHIE